MIAKKMGVLRLSEQDEILGGDIHYFMPIDFIGNIEDYDMAMNVGKIVEMRSPMKDIEMSKMKTKEEPS